jgi:hypothetical protein
MSASSTQVSECCQWRARDLSFCEINIAVVSNLMLVKRNLLSDNSYSNIATFVRGKYVIRKSSLYMKINTSKWKCVVLQDRGAQITDARSPCRLNFVRWRLIFLDPKCGTCFMPLFWRLKSWGGSYIFEKFVHPCCTMYIILHDCSKLVYSYSSLFWRCIIWNNESFVKL